jgi:hypothetical protein
MKELRAPVMDIQQLARRPAPEQAMPAA